MIIIYFPKTLGGVSFEKDEVEPRGEASPLQMNNVKVLE